MKNYLNNPISYYLLPILIIIIIHVAASTFTDPILFDSNEYLSIAKNLYENNEYSISNVNTKDFGSFKGESPTRMRQPIYPIFLSFFYFSFGENLILLLILQLILSIISFLVFIKVGKIIFKDDYFSKSNFILAMYFPLWMLSASVLTETIFTLLLVLFIYYLIKASFEKKIDLFVYSGSILGISFLTRPIALFVLFALSVFILVDKIHQFKLRFLLFLILGFILAITPWFFRNIISLGDVTLLSSDGGYNFYNSTLGVDNKAWFDDLGFSESVSDGYYIDREANNNFMKLGLTNLKANPIQYFSFGVQRFIATWTYFPGSRYFKDNLKIFIPFTIVQLVILITAFFGFWSFRNYRGINFLLIPILAFSIVIFFSYSISRFLIPIIPFVLLLSGQGIMRILAYRNHLKK